MTHETCIILDDNKVLTSSPNRTNLAPLQALVGLRRLHQHTGPGLGVVMSVRTHWSLKEAMVSLRITGRRTPMVPRRMRVIATPYRLSHRAIRTKRTVLTKRRSNSGAPQMADTNNPLLATNLMIQGIMGTMVQCNQQWKMHLHLPVEAMPESEMDHGCRNTMNDDMTKSHPQLLSI